LDTSKKTSKEKELVCITGASGFLGKALVNKFLNSGYRVLALSRTKSLSTLNFQENHIDHIYGDIEVWEDAITKYRPDFVISCDWQGVERLERDNSHQATNIDRIVRIGRSALNAEVRGILVFGSQAEVEPSTSLILEKSAEKPQNEYARAKILLHEQLNSLVKDSQTNLIWGRIFTIYGPGDHRDSVVTQGIKKLSAGESFTIQKPNLKWSFLYIDDFTLAVETIIQQKNLRGVVNIGNPLGEELRSLKDALAHVFDLPIVDGSFQREEESITQKTWIPKVETLSKLGWEPQTPLKEGIFRTVMWWRSKVSLY
jgi:UDP-glucose 4-epimerase